MNWQEICAWASRESLARHGVANPCPESPECAVEVLSESSARAETDEHNGLSLFARGAEKLQPCDADRATARHDTHRALPKSRTVPDCPDRIALPF